MGFSKAEQAFLAALIRSLHGRFQPQTFVAPSSRFTSAVSFLAIVLRLSVVLHRNRLPVSKTGLKVEGDAQGLSMHFPPGWLADHPLTAGFGARGSRSPDGGFRVTLRLIVARHRMAPEMG